jgi:hypothetical protein
MNDDIMNEVRRTLNNAESLGDSVPAVPDLTLDQKIQYMQASALTSLAGSHLVLVEKAAGIEQELLAIERHLKRIADLQ